MTGFGVAAAPVGGGRLQVEVRSVNHRHFNLQLKVPSELQRLEVEIRDRLRDRITRGHVTVSARWIEEPARAGTLRLNLDRARQVAAALRQLKAVLNLSGDIDLGWVARQSDVLQPAESEQAPLEAADVLVVVDAAAEAMLAMRRVEGAALGAELERLLVSLERQLEVVEQRAPQRLVAERDRLRASVAALLDGRSPDEARLAQEIALLADKVDITEEVVRLKAHIAACRSALQHDAATAGGGGRQLGFLGQEMLREINTIGSKANDAAIAQAVVTMKGELERFREQVENVE
jgi:uncharacterized protein (TIGR00255 family)